MTHKTLYQLDFYPNPKKPKLTILYFIKPLYHLNGFRLTLLIIFFIYFNFKCIRMKLLSSIVDEVKYTS